MEWESCGRRGLTHTRSDEAGESLSDPEAHFTGVREQLDDVSVDALVAGRRDERLEARADLARRQVTGSRDELDPEAHAALASVAQLEDRGSGKRTVVHEVEDSHLIQVEDDLKVVRRMDSQSVEVASASFAQRGDEARFLDFDFLQDLLHHLHHFSDALAHETASQAHALSDEGVHLVNQVSARRPQRLGSCC